MLLKINLIECRCIIQNSTNKSKYFNTKAEKILSYRKKHSAIRHEYFVMAQKYMSYNKVLLTFTVPTDMKDKTIKNGRYSKLRKLIKIRAYIAKLLNNSSDTKYFMNIELGEHYSNPHLHLQLWVKDTTSASTQNIYNKTIAKFDLNKNRCYITEPTNSNIPIYNYVIKDYAKDLSDNDLWNLEIQKKRFRKVMGTRVRFYSKSKDVYCKSIYRKLYYGLGIVRDKANDFLDFFINKFFFFNKRNLPKISALVLRFSVLSNKEQERILFVSFVWLFDLLFASPARGPPVLLFIHICKQKIYLEGVIMFMFYFVRVVLVWSFILEIEERIRSPCFQYGWSCCGILKFVSKTIDI